MQARAGRIVHQHPVIGVRLPGERGHYFRLADDALARSVLAQTGGMLAWRELMEPLLDRLPTDRREPVRTYSAGMRARFCCVPATAI